MEFPNIIALVDARLDLLQRVRELLVPSCSRHGSAPRKRSIRRVVESQSLTTRTEELSAGAPQISSPSGLPAPLRLAPILPKQRISRSKSVAFPESRTALSGYVPTTPVAVSAEKVRAEEAHRRTLEEQLQPAREIPFLEADQISRKWLTTLTDNPTTAERDQAQKIDKSIA
jgi:hypothetical protein